MLKFCRVIQWYAAATLSLSFDFRHVEEAGGAAHEYAAGKCELGYALQAALVEGAGAVGDARATLEHGGEEGVVLQALEFLVGAEVPETGEFIAGKGLRG